MTQIPDTPSIERPYCIMVCANQLPHECPGPELALTPSAGEGVTADAIAADLRAQGYWQREIVLSGDGGYEDTWRTKEGYETLTPSPPLEQPDIDNAVEAGARALEPNLWTGNNGMSDARSSQAVVNARNFARSMARKCIEAALACPPSRPSFDKWAWAGAVLADARCAK